MKVINVPAVTDANGHAVCATTSTHSLAACPDESVSQSSYLYPGINEYAEDYFSGVKTAFSRTVATVLTDTGMNIPFATPYVYLPPHGSSEILGEPPEIDPIAGGSRDPASFVQSSGTMPSSGPQLARRAHEINRKPRKRALEPAVSYSDHLDGADVDFGYIPQGLIDWMAKDSNYVSQYPGIASCLPGGPSIDLGGGGCTTYYPVAPEQAVAAPDLTTSDTATVTSAGCFRPGACQASKPSATAEPAALPSTANSPTAQPKSPLSSPSAMADIAVPVMTPLESQPANQQSSPATVAQNSPAESDSGAESTAAGSPSGSDNVPSDQKPSLNQVLPPTPADNPSPSNPTPSQNVAPADSPAPSLAASEGSPQGPSQIAPNVQGASPVAVASQTQGLGGVIASALGFTPATTPAAPANNQGSGTIEPAVLAPTYTLAIAPSASAVVINGVTSNLSPQQNAPVIATDSQSVTVAAVSPVAIAGQTIIPGAPAVTIQGTPVSYGTAADNIVVGSSTIPIPPNGASPVVNVGSDTFTARPASPHYIVGSQTILPGGSAISMGGTPVNVPSGGSSIIVGESTIPLLPFPEIAGSNGGAPPPLVIGSQTFSANSASLYVIGGQTITPGAPAVIITAPAGISPTPTADSGAIQQPVTVGGQVFTPNPTAFEIGGTTISAGGAGVTVQGTVVSLQPSRGGLIVGSSTIPLGSVADQTPVTIGSQVFTPNPTGFSVAGESVSAGGPGITVQGSFLSLEPLGSGLVIGSRTISLAKTTGLQSTVASSSASANASASASASTSRLTSASRSDTGSPAGTPTAKSSSGYSVKTEVLKGGTLWVDLTIVCLGWMLLWI